MKRKLAMCLLLGALSVCSTTVFAEETEAVETEAAETAEGSAEMSDDIYSFQVMINDQLYQFPMSYADFTAAGWEYANDATAEIEPYSYSAAERFTKDGLTAYATIYNLGINTVPFSDASIGGVSVDEWQYKDAPDTKIVFPKGIEYGVSSVDDITAAYGPASDTYEGELYTKLTYSYDTYQNVDFYVDIETGVIDEFQIRNLIEDENANSSAAADVSDEPTEAVLAYSAPTELGDDLRSFIVEYAGDMYQLPAPVSAFEANGWTIKDEDSDAIVPGGGTSGWVYMIKDNQEYHALAKNYDANAAVIRNCFVTSVESDIYGADLPITIQKGITRDMTIEELEAALEGEDFEVESSSERFAYYNIYSADSKLDRVQIAVNKEENKVISIEVQNSPRSLD